MDANGWLNFVGRFKEQKGGYIMTNGGRLQGYDGGVSWEIIAVISPTWGLKMIKPCNIVQWK